MGRFVVNKEDKNLICRECNKSIGKYHIYYEDIGRYSLKDVKKDFNFEVKNFVVCRNCARKKGLIN